MPEVYAIRQDVVVPHRRERRKDARPGELIDAAIDVFAERGFAAARLDDIAQRAGVTKGTVYLYFSSKEELFEAAVRQTLMSSIAHGQSVLRDFQGSTTELLESVLRGWWHGVVRTKAAPLAKLIFAEATNFPELACFYHENVIEPGRRLLARILERGIASGEFRDVPVNHTVSFVIAPFLYLQFYEHSIAVVVPAASVETESFLEALIDHVLASLTIKGHAV